MIKVLISLAILAAATSAAAQPLDLDAIAKQPGTQVTRRDDTVEIKRGNVTVTIDKNGETGIDHSGHAVLCYWDLAVVAKISADLCYPGEFPQLSALLGQFIDAANTFIATNSLRPVTRAQLEKNIADRSAQNRVCQRQREDDLVPLNAELEKH